MQTMKAAMKSKVENKEIPIRRVKRRFHRPVDEKHDSYERFVEIAVVRQALDELALLAKRNYSYFSAGTCSSLFPGRRLWAINFCLPVDDMKSLVFDVTALNETCLYDINLGLRDLPFRDPVLRLLLLTVDYEASCKDTADGTFEPFDVWVTYDADEPNYYDVTAIYDKT